MMKEPLLLSGKVIREKLLSAAKAECARLIQQFGSPAPKLVALAVGRDSSGDLYLNSQKKACESVGALHEIRDLPESSTTDRLVEEIEKLNQDKFVDGVIVQMPLPKHIDLDRVLSRLHWSKDVEGVSPYSLGLLFMGRPHLVPCTPAACVEFIKASGADLYGKEVVVAGASVSVGKPVSILLLDQMATVTICRSSAGKAGTLEGHVRRADVLVAAMGKAEAIAGSWIKEGAVVIDVGIHVMGEKTVGDVEFETARKKALAITPVPGGVGPVTTAILVTNLIKASLTHRSNNVAKRK